MVQAQNINGSTKRIGKYEAKIIKSLIQYFEIDRYEVIPHARLNIAWGSILSDIDLLLLKKGTLTYVEVKSHKDNFLKAIQQIERVKDYVDYAFVATDRLVSDWDIPKIGLISACGDNVNFIRKPERFRNKPRFSSIISLQKKCLVRFLGNGHTCHTYAKKYELARYVYKVRTHECTRKCLKEIVTCGNTCEIICPISKFVKGN
jgi:hypothetical protein